MQYTWRDFFRRMVPGGRSGLPAEVPSDAEIERLKESLEAFRDDVAKGERPDLLLFPGARHRSFRGDPDAVDSTLAAVMDSVEAILAHHDLDEVVPPEDQEILLHIEVVTRLTGRPSFPVFRGTIDLPVDDLWHYLRDELDGIERNIPAVGRVESPGGYGYGTAFLVSPSLAITNVHVAEAFADYGRLSLHLVNNLYPNIELLGEFENPSREPIAIVGVERNDVEHDIALLRVQNVPAWVRPMWLARDRRPVGDAYLIGFPTIDNTGLIPSKTLSDIFKEWRGHKSVQPGSVVGEGDGGTLFHDASTLGGSSGSPLIDLKQHVVIGVHRGGVDQRVGPGSGTNLNYATAIWDWLHSLDSERLQRELWIDA